LTGCNFTYKVQRFYFRSQAFRALTGLNPDEFADLLPLFSVELDNRLSKKTFTGRMRLNKYTQRKKDSIPDDEDKLFFVLIYLKNNLTQELLAALFDMSQDMASRWIQLLTEVLEKTLRKYIPKQILPAPLDTTADYLVDATERRIQRPKYNQEYYYSKKKLIH
jgi:hypothetical protein